MYTTSRKVRKKGKRPFSPSEPQIGAGKYVGRKLSDLSNEELTDFVREDARQQTRTVTMPLFSFWPSQPNPSAPFPRFKSVPMAVQDLTQYWFARYELERRKPDSQRDPISTVVTNSDTPESAALKLTEYGFRLASQKYHPDRGGDTAIMQILNLTRQFAQTRLKT